MRKITYIVIILFYLSSCTSITDNNKNLKNEPISNAANDELEIEENVLERNTEELDVEKIEIRIEDSNLESQIRSIINKDSGTLYNIDILEVENISIYGTEIQTLNGLEYFTNLKTLELYNSKVKNIDSISKLYKLEILTFYDANITDITPIISLPLIKHLDLMWNPISDLTPIKNYTNLRYLAVDNFKDSDIQNIRGSFESIDELLLPQGKYSDISYLEFLPNLRHVLLDSETLEDFSVLNKLPNIEFLEITSRKLNNIDFTNNMSKLKSINLLDTTITDIKPLENLPIEELYLWDTEVIDFSIISSLKNIRRLAITGPSLENIDFLLNNKTLEYLDIFHSNVTDISVLLELPMLQSIGIRWLDINSDGINRIIPELEKKNIRIN